MQSQEKPGSGGRFRKGLDIQLYLRGQGSITHVSVIEIYELSICVICMTCNMEDAETEIRSPVV